MITLAGHFLKILWLVWVGLSKISCIYRSEGFVCVVDRVPGCNVDEVTEVLMDVGAASVR